MIDVTAIFDIGKTNKKFFLFDKDFKEVYKEYTSFDEITDEDGFPTENLKALQEWLKSVFNRILEANEYKVLAINFSTYGASFVDLDENGDQQCHPEACRTGGHREIVEVNPDARDDG